MQRAIALVTVMFMAFAATTFAACDAADDDRPGHPPTATATNSPIHSPVPSEPTGVKMVDDTIAAIKSGSTQALVDFVVLGPEACAPAGNGAGGPPACDPGEAAGTRIDVVPLFSCEGGWARSSALPQALSPLAEEGAQLFAVYRGGPTLFGRSGAYSVIFTTPTANGALARNLVVGGDGVIGIDLGCGESARQMVERHKLTDALYLRG